MVNSISKTSANKNRKREKINSVLLWMNFPFFNGTISDFIIQRQMCWMGVTGLYSMLLCHIICFNAIFSRDNMQQWEFFSVYERNGLPDAGLWGTYL